MSPSAQATPRPTSRGCRMHQNTSTSATKSGTRRRSRQGRKLRNSASANEAMMVLARTGCRICWLATSIDVFGARATRFLFARLYLLRSRRSYGLAVEHEHEAAAIDARGRLAHHTRKRVLGIALDAHHARHRQSGRIGAVDARGDQAIVAVNVGVRRHEAQLEHARGAAAEGHRAQ